MTTSRFDRDHLTDANPVAVNYAVSRIPLPEYCAETASAEKRAGLASSAFADPDNRLFPISSPGDTLLSAIYAFGLPAGDKKAAILRPIMDAVNAWGIKPDCDRYQAVFEEAEKSAGEIPEEEPFEKFALTVDYGDGRKEHYYPCDNILDIEKSAKLLLQHTSEGRLPSVTVIEVARSLKKAAEREGAEVSLPAKVVKLAEEREFDPERALHLVFSRKAACKENPEAFALYEDLIKGAAEDRSQLDECVRLMDDLDRALNVKYANGMPLPYEVFHCGMTTEEFRKFAHSIVTIAGVLVPQQVVGSVKESAVRQFWPKAKADLLVPVVKAAADSPTSVPARELVEALDPDLQKDFLAFLTTQD